MNDNFDNIKKYFDGTLKETDKQSFEDKWEHDDSFAQEIAFYLRLRTELKQEKLNNVNAALENDIKEEVKEKPFFARRIGLSLAAGLALLIGVFFIYQLTNTTLDSSGIAANYDSSFDTKNMMDDIQSTQGIAGGNWDEQKAKMQILDSLFIYDKPACTITSQTYLDNTETPYFKRETQILKALSLKETNKESYSASKKILEELKNSGDTDYQDVVLWNLSIINLYENNIDVANEMLDDLIKSYPNSKYTENAEKILQKIN